MKGFTTVEYGHKISQLSMRQLVHHRCNFHNKLGLYFNQLHYRCTSLRWHSTVHSWLSLTDLSFLRSSRCTL